MVQILIGDWRADFWFQFLWSLVWFLLLGVLSICGPLRVVGLQDAVRLRRGACEVGGLVGGEGRVGGGSGGGDGDAGGGRRAHKSWLSPPCWQELGLVGLATASARAAAPERLRKGWICGLDCVVAQCARDRDYLNEIRDAVVGPMPELTESMDPLETV